MSTWTAPEAGWYRFPPWPPVKIEHEGDLVGLIPEPGSSVTVVEFPTEPIPDE